MLDVATLAVTGIAHPVPRLGWGPLPSLHHQQLQTPQPPSPPVLWGCIILGEIWGCLQTPVLSWAEPWGCPGSGVLPHTLVTPNCPHQFTAQPHLPGSLPAPKPISSSSETLLPPL